MDEAMTLDSLARALESDASRHEAGGFDDVGNAYDDLLNDVLPFWDSHADELAMGFHFWDCWIDARNHDWRYYPDAAPDDWPKFARVVAAALRAREMPAGVPASLTTVPPTVRARVRTWFRRRGIS